MAVSVSRYSLVSCVGRNYSKDSRSLLHSKQLVGRGKFRSR